MRTVEELEAGLRGDDVTGRLGAPDLDRIRRAGRRHRLARRATGAAAGLTAAAAVAGVALWGASLAYTRSSDAPRQGRPAPMPDQELPAICLPPHPRDRATRPPVP